MARIRSGQYSRLRQYMEMHANDCMIVGGDFNAHPAGPEYRKMSELATDAFTASGAGFGFSLTATMPCERFDYIWCRNVEPMRCEVLPDIVSDHRAVVAWVSCPK
jgi:vancomycin resistance protein VanJ